MSRLLINGIAQAAGTILTAVLVREAFEGFAESSTVSGAKSFPIEIGALAVIISGTLVLRVIERRDAALLGESYVSRIRLRLFDAVTGGPLIAGPGQHRSLGPALLPFVTDLTAVRQWVSNGLARLLVSILVLVGGLAALFMIDVGVGLTVVGLASFCALSGMVLGRRLSRRIRHQRRRRGQMAAYMGDRLQALSVIRFSGRIDSERSVLARRSRRLTHAAVSRARLSAVVRILPDVALGSSTVAILALGGQSFLSGEAGQGSVIAALMVLGAVAPQARVLGRVFEYWKNYQVALGRLNGILGPAKRRRRRRGNYKPEPDATGCIEFDGAAFHGGLRDITLVCPPGSRTALVGPSGSGKSSLLMAGAGLYRPLSGEVRLDGEEVSSLDPARIARSIGIVSPDLPLLRGTLRENLSYRIPEASDRDLVEVCNAVGIDLESRYLPEGLDTGIKEQGAGLPSGLRQEICLARALVGDPAVLILDDPDRGLDPQTRAALDRRLSETRATVLLATREAERARSADVVCYLEDGQVLETGNAEDLLVRDGPVKRFFDARTEAPSDRQPRVLRLSSARFV